MKKVLILQNTILHYRKALYNELSKNYDVTILHSGKVSKNQDDYYNEIVCKNKKIGPFYLQTKVLSEVRKHKYDAIISMFDIRWICNIVAMYTHRRQAKFIWWGAWITDNKLANKIRLYLTNKKHNSILYTEDAKESFVKLGVNKNKLFVANNTFDVGKRKKCYLHENKNSILFVGSLNERKENDVLIKAFNSIKNEIRKDINLVFVGDGKEEDYLKALVQELQLNERVIFIGRINDADRLIDFYKEAIVSVSFGQAGLSVLQSFGFGVPFVTKRNAISGGEKTNIKHGENGFFSEDNITSLESILIRLINDIEYSRKLGKFAYEYYTNFCTIENMAKGMVSAIEN
ncbi:glycosyltransferase involved in cell wall biosynthesis [Aquimarina sp. EL_43]|uniref:glycosyltransferase family 4 protein n=1 Tax=unclassified Aquimarina TaxID=2627091 RepID=UPI0018C8F662|nr:MULTISPECIES: glycosyltransferase family 4 protein [unclassified Aquimarina]MBG6131708.1 glycosyltransferase involved in cell wall biosynthesis [Aquimarina sp. EL_35]MBG6152169.1 glycosyltransferase involved in cell wall biosynthesis [Aquimarina sp. EL_32]MBG6169887.1 glycosyltransferase involved in cell wall biosynthesis [Aquimarina sp. EL_43]